MLTQRLKQSMSEQGITQKELSIMTGISKSGISQYLSGKHEPSQKALESMADALAVPVGWLTGEIEADEEPARARNNLPVARAAKLMGVCQQFVRIGLQRGTLPFGYAIRITGNKYTYYISPKKFTETTGIEVT